MDTPPFLLWSLEYACQVRGFETGRDPERIERLLRAARLASDALLEDRVQDGICLSPPYGFRLDEALALYGGRTAVETACTRCPANAAARQRPETWAGCFGMTPLADPQEVERRLSRAMEVPAVDAEYRRLFYVTRPVWNGLWLPSPINAPRATWLASVFETCRFAELSIALAQLQAGLKTAAELNVPLYVAAYPPGQVIDGWWKLAPHCPRCKAIWGKTNERRCNACEYTGPPAPDKKRRARGRRPYLLLERLLGAAAANDFLARYEARRAAQTATHPQENPLRQEPPDSPPDG